MESRNGWTTFHPSSSSETPTTARLLAPYVFWNSENNGSSCLQPPDYRHLNDRNEYRIGARLLQEEVDTSQPERRQRTAFEKLVADTQKACFVLSFSERGDWLTANGAHTALAEAATLWDLNGKTHFSLRHSNIASISYVASTILKNSKSSAGILSRVSQKGWSRGKAGGPERNQMSSPYGIGGKQLRIFTTEPAQMLASFTDATRKGVEFIRSIEGRPNSAFTYTSSAVRRPMHVPAPEKSVLVNALPSAQPT